MPLCNKPPKSLHRAQHHDNIILLANARQVSSYSVMCPIVFNDQEMVEIVSLFALDPVPLDPENRDDDEQLRSQCCQKDNIELSHVLQPIIIDIGYIRQ